MDLDQVLGLKCSKCVRFSLSGREIGGGGSSDLGGHGALAQRRGKKMKIRYHFVFILYSNLGLCCC